MSNIADALTRLDPYNNDHWTADGMPRVDVVARFANAPELTRADITSAAPALTRDTSRAGPSDEVTDGDPVAPPNELDRLLAELGVATEAMYKAQGELEVARVTADKMANLVNGLNRKIEVLTKQDPNHGTAGVRAYLKQQNQNRVRRATGLRRFIESTGMHPKDVASAIDPKAPIDRAMSQRRAARGTLRPASPRV